MGYGSQIQFALILSVPVACITWTVTQEEVFQEFRSYCLRCQARCQQSWWRKKLAYMSTCAYCFSHYVAAALVALLHFQMLVEDWRGYLVSLFTVVLIANVYITGYHLLRVGLRWSRSRADEVEKSARDGRVGADRTGAGRVSASRGAVPSLDVSGTVPLRHRSAREATRRA
jgi:hypothetical protein